jgi:hypothetical protein
VIVIVLHKSKGSIHLTYITIWSFFKINNLVVSTPGFPIFFFFTFSFFFALDFLLIMDPNTDIPNVQLATIRMTQWSTLRLERYICRHGPHRFRRDILRDLVSNRVHPLYPTIRQVYLVIALRLYRAGHRWSVINCLQFEGYLPYPPEQDDWTLLERSWVGRWWTEEEWALGGRDPPFFLPLDLWQAL